MKRQKLVFLILAMLFMSLGVFAQGGCPGNCSGSGCSGSCGGGESREFSQAVVSTETLVSLLRSKTPLALIVCRTDNTDTGKKIPGARTMTASFTADQVAAIVPTKDSLIITYDDAKNEPLRSAVAQNLKALGYLNILDYPGGLDEWIASNTLEIDKPSK